MRFPNNKKFAFTILDDTDDANVENIVPVYDFLTSKNIFVTKTVWPVPCPEGSRIFFAGQTLGEKDYLKAVKRIIKQGHELAFHCATMESSERKRTKQAFEVLKKEFDLLPVLHCNHGQNLENIYWGYKRFSTAIFRLVYAGLKRKYLFQGENSNSEYFWGDIYNAQIKFSRNFTFRNELNILKSNPEMPYLDSAKKMANYFFSTSDAPDVFAFNSLVTKKAIDRLENEAGLCILSTHLGKKYCLNGKINENFRSIIEYISKKDGWFVPVTEILEYLLSLKHKSKHYISYYSRLRLEILYVINTLGIKYEFSKIL